MFIRVSVSYGTQGADNDSNIIFFISMPHPIKIASAEKRLLIYALEVELEQSVERLNGMGDVVGSFPGAVLNSWS